MTEIPVSTETKVDPAGARNDENSGAIVDLRSVRATKGVDARISLWACFYRVVIGMHHADMIKSDFRSKRDFAQWARSANLAFFLPRGYGVGRRGNNTQSPFGRKSPRKYFVALTQFWHWYQVLFASSSALVVVEEKCGFGLAVRHEVKAERGGRSFLREQGLSGELFELERKEDYESLRDAGYPSLFVAHGKHYILAGPLSLVNERCSLAKIYLQWGSNLDANEVWLKTREKGHVFAAGERLWTRYEFGKLSVAKDQCFCPDTGCHKSF